MTKDGEISMLMRLVQERNDRISELVKKVESQMIEIAKLKRLLKNQEQVQSILIAGEKGSET